MNVLLLKSPYEVSLTGNPMPFVFQLTPYGDMQRKESYKLHISVLIETNYRSRVYVDCFTQIFYPDISGQIKIDVHSILEAYSEFYTPKLSLQKILRCENQSKRYKISYQLQYNDEFVTSLTTTNIFYAIKGGLPYEEWNPIYFFTKNILTDKQPLHYPPAGEKISPDQKIFFYWIYPFDDLADQSVTYTFKLEDGTIDTFTPSATAKSLKWGITVVPSGISQINYTPPGGKLVVSYTIQVFAGATAITAPYTYTIDYRTFYNDYRMLYRNSLGGLDPLRLRGQVDIEADYEYQKSSRISADAYYTNQTLLPQLIQMANVETLKCIGDTGFISKEATDNLRDLFLSKQIFEIISGKLLPLILTANNIKLRSNNDALFALTVSWQRAFLNEFYAPDNAVIIDATCPALEMFDVVQINKSTLQISWAMQLPYDRIKVQIIADATNTFIYSGNTGSVEQAFENPATTGPESITVTGQTICDEETIPMSVGPLGSITFDVFPNSLPVAVPDTFNINSGYNTLTLLDGNLLDNDFDPDGDLIECTSASGTTAEGGNYVVNTDGTAQYKPPTTVFIGIDSFNYKVHEVSDPLAESPNAKVTINVGGTVLVKVYAKLVPWEFYTVWNPPQFSLYGKFYVNFYSDIACTQLLDVSDLGIILNMHSKVNSGGTITDTDYTVPATGVQVLIHDGLISKDDPNPFFDYLIEFTLQPGDGYTVVG